MCKRERGSSLTGTSRDEKKKNKKYIHSPGGKKEVERGKIGKQKQLFATSTLMLSNKVLLNRYLNGNFVS